MYTFHHILVMQMQKRKRCSRIVSPIILNIWNITQDFRGKVLIMVILVTAAIMVIIHMTTEL